ncbi:MAG: hypothetical protein AAF725_02605 [Acidobacteriota bacterium]
MSRCLVAAIAGAGLAATAGAGTFHLSDVDPYPPFATVHPAAYDGTGGPVEVRVCIKPGLDEITRPAVDEAIKMWNQLEATPENCLRCRTFEQGPLDTDDPFSMTSVVLHEFGHCGVGLGHTNWRDTSHTESLGAASFSVGADNIFGSADDRPAPLPGTRVLHWFRSADNDPFTFSPPVDRTTYSRRIIDLPSGSSWPANANLGVGLLLGRQSTQAVMYSALQRGASYRGFTADAVNTVLFAASGVDEIAGTSDDYTIRFVSTDCASADIEVRYGMSGQEESRGSCLADLDPLPAAGAQVHYSLKPFITEDRAVVTISDSARFDVVFANGFESGNTSAWSETLP